MHRHHHQHNLSEASGVKAAEFGLLLSHRNFVVGLQMCLGAQKVGESTAAQVQIEAIVFVVITEILLLLCYKHLIGNERMILRHSAWTVAVTIAIATATGSSNSNQWSL